MVHRRELNGQEIVLGNQGDLWGNAMTWWDHETGSVWSQPLGEAILGPLKGESLELLPSTLTQWAAWRDSHPDTIALDGRGGTTGFDLSQMVVVAEFGGVATAYPFFEVRELGVVNDVVADTPIAVVIDPQDPQRWAVFSRLLDDGVVELAVVDGALIDLDSGTVFDPVRGRALDGPLSGQVMDILPAITAFPRDFFTFWPQGKLWRLEEGDPVLGASRRIDTGDLSSG